MMDKNTIQQLIDLNIRFYKKVHADFSRTRQQAWKGGTKLIPYITKYIGHNLDNSTNDGNRNIKTKKVLNILDVGCGNGRFLKFLRDNLNLNYWNINYTGIDSNENLLKEASKYKHNNKQIKVTLIKADIIGPNMQMIVNKLSNVGKFNVIVAFGITHHIPCRHNRIEWFKRWANILNDGGLLIATFWNVAYLGKQGKSVPAPKTINKENLEKGDMFLGWANTNAVRYCHQWTQNELEELNTYLRKAGLQHLTTFNSDGRTNELNKYIIWKK